MVNGVSIAKLSENVPNEDSIFFSDNCIAVSDGAGGCGLYADEWSRYLIEQLPKENAICSFSELDKWVDGIWKSFYNEHEERAKEGDGILLNKYYNEGSCATIAAAWLSNEKECRWMTYGDSVVFHYSHKTGVLEHSFTRLADFSNSPRLVSCKDPLEEEGFRGGTFYLDETSVAFAASDALSHYILMMYELSKRSDYTDELDEERLKQTSNSLLLMNADKLNIDFEKNVLSPLLKSLSTKENFLSLMRQLNEQSLIDIDDYSMVVMY